MKWGTRERPKVDRIAYRGLIKLVQHGGSSPAVADLRDGPRRSSRQSHQLPALFRRRVLVVTRNAGFLYAPQDELLAVAERDGATSYDIPDAEPGHCGAECSFDAMVRKYDLTRILPWLAWG